MADNEIKPKIVTKKHQARIDRERAQRKITLTVFAVIAAAIILVLGYGVLDQYVFKKIKPVAVVDDVKITQKDFTAQASFIRVNKINQAYMYYQYNQMLSGYFASQLAQASAELINTDSLATSILDGMIDNIVIEKEAAKLGITVSDAEIEEAMKASFNYYPNGTPVPSPTVAPQPTSTQSALQMTLAAPPATATPAVTPTTAPTEVPVTPTVTPTVDPSIPTATPYPTATPITEEGYNGLVTDYLDSVQNSDFSREQLRENVRMNLLTEKVVEAVTKDMATSEEQVWARHILVATEAEALAVLDRLNNGEDWYAVAAEVSTDTSNKDQGGDLGWFSKDSMVAEFSEGAWALEVGQISQPIQTSFGYHIIQSLGKEVRPLADNMIQYRKQQLFAEWKTARKAEHTISITESISLVDLMPTLPEIPQELLSAATAQ